MKKKSQAYLVRPALCSLLPVFGLCGPLSLVPVALACVVALALGRDVAFVAMSFWPVVAVAVVCHEVVAMMMVVVVVVRDGDGGS